MFHSHGYSEYGLNASFLTPPLNITVGVTSYDLNACEQDKGAASGIELAAIILGLFIVFMNFLAIVLIIRYRDLHRAIYFCICNLAVADLLAGFLLFWIFFLQKFLPFRSSFSDLIQKSVWALTVWSSFLNQLVIAVDCYCIVRRGRTYIGTWGSSKRKWGIITGLTMTWLIPIGAFVVPVVTVWHCANHCHCYKPSNANSSDIIYMFCFPLDDCSMTNPPFTKASMLYIGLFLVAMPIVPCVLYGKIFQKVRETTQKTLTARSRNSIPSTSGDYELNTFSKSAAAPLSSCADDSIVSTNQNADISTYTSQPNTSATNRLVQPRNSMIFQSGCQHGTYAQRKSSSASKGKRSTIFNAFTPKTLTSAAETPTNNGTKNHSREEKIRRLYQLRKASSVFLNKLSVEKRDIAVFKTLVMILACYVISTVPLGILFLVSFGETDKRYVVPAKGLLILSLINSLLNPIIYMMRFKDMKKNFKRMFCFARSHN